MSKQVKPCSFERWLLIALRLPDKTSLVFASWQGGLWAHSNAARAKPAWKHFPHRGSAPTFSGSALCLSQLRDSKGTADARAASREWWWGATFQQVPSEGFFFFYIHMFFIVWEKQQCHRPPPRCLSHPPAYCHVVPVPGRPWGTKEA